MGQVLVAGGGASGLMAAISAARRGAKVTLLEQNKQTGRKLIVTGNGRVSHGAQFVLDQIGFARVDNDDFVNDASTKGLVYTVADVDSLVRRKDGVKRSFDFDYFRTHSNLYDSDFLKFACSADVLVSGHYWDNDNPVYLSGEDLRREDLQLAVIGDITCDILGSIKSTLRSSTHSDPFYDYNPQTGKEEPAFSSERNITVMAVDTLPNALALDTSKYFGEMLSKYVFDDILSGNIENSRVIQRATIIKAGKLTPRFSYLEQYAQG